MCGCHGPTQSRKRWSEGDNCTDEAKARSTCATPAAGSCTGSKGRASRAATVWGHKAPITGCARHTQRATGRRRSNSGSFTRRVLGTFFSATACCCLVARSSCSYAFTQAGPHAGAWLTAIPSDPHTTLSPVMMQIALRRCLRLSLPLAARRCGGHGGQSIPGCGRFVDEHGDLVCCRTRGCRP